MKRFTWLFIVLVMFACVNQGCVSRLYDRQAGGIVDADKDDAEFDNTNNAVNAHIANASAHGVTGNVVGTAGEQTITGPKTLVSPIITTSPTAAGATWVDLGTVTTMIANSSTLVTTDINGGRIDGTRIGVSSAETGNFTALGAGSLSVGGTSILSGPTYIYGETRTFSKTIVLPEYVQDETDAVPLFPVNNVGGIKITKFGIATNASSTYSVVLEDWTSPTSGSVADISTVATSSTSEAASGALTATVPNSDIVMIDLPTTTGLKWLMVYFEYELLSE